MRVALTPKEFDEYIRASGADYVLTIQDSERAKLVGEFLAALDIEAVRSDAETIGVRYRLECNARGKPKRTLYITKFGSIVDGGRELRPRNRETWLSELWGVLQEDVLLMRTVPEREP